MTMAIYLFFSYYDVIIKLEMVRIYIYIKDIHLKTESSTLIVM